jgi:hypothetical protein
MSKFVDATIAVKSLCPEAEFIMHDNDYSTIQWHVKPATVPTLAEVNAEVQRLLLA